MCGRVYSSLAGGHFKVMEDRSGMRKIEKTLSIANIYLKKKKTKT